MPGPRDLRPVARLSGATQRVSCSGCARIVDASGGLEPQVSAFRFALYTATPSALLPANIGGPVSLARAIRRSGYRGVQARLAPTGCTRVQSAFCPYVVNASIVGKRHTVEWIPRPPVADGPIAYAGAPLVFDPRVLAASARLELANSRSTGEYFDPLDSKPLVQAGAVVTPTSGSLCLDQRRFIPALSRLAAGQSELRLHVGADRWVRTIDLQTRNLPATEGAGALRRLSYICIWWVRRDSNPHAFQT